MLNILSCNQVALRKFEIRINQRRWIIQQDRKFGSCQTVAMPVESANKLLRLPTELAGGKPRVRHTWPLKLLLHSHTLTGADQASTSSLGSPMGEEERCSTFSQACNLDIMA
jgi:hypothetical protein